MAPAIPGYHDEYNLFFSFVYCQQLRARSVISTQISKEIMPVDFAESVTQFNRV